MLPGSMDNVELRPSDKAQQYLSLLSPPQDHKDAPSSINCRLRELRQLILLESLPQDPEEAARVRPVVWKLLLRLNVLPAEAEDEPHPLMDSRAYLDLT